MNTATQSAASKQTGNVSKQMLKGPAAPKISPN